MNSLNEIKQPKDRKLYEKKPFTLIKDSLIKYYGYANKDNDGVIIFCDATNIAAFKAIRKQAVTLGVDFDIACEEAIKTREKKGYP